MVMYSSWAFLEVGFERGTHHGGGEKEAGGGNGSAWLTLYSCSAVFSPFEGMGGRRRWEYGSGACYFLLFVFLSPF